MGYQRKPKRKIRWFGDGITGDIQRSRDSRFVIISSVGQNVLLDRGRAIMRMVREDHLKLYAETLVK
jgi:hypothetical protein